MEIANLPHLRRRRATTTDARDLHRLLRRAEYQHLHIDWRLPAEWLDTPGAVLVETAESHPAGPGHLRACLAVGAEPPPAAWVRIFALYHAGEARPLLERMLEWVIPYLRREGVAQLGWLPREGLPPGWVEATGFHLINHVETFVREGVDPPESAEPNRAVEIRPVQAGDFPRLAAIEAEAFDPLWRHSVDSLRRGWHHARSFHVAVLDGEIAGFEYSADSDHPRAVHLVRLTVSPRVQRIGIGSTLLIAALDSYRRQGVRRVSLNTQADNLASRRLYQKFDFKTVGQQLPVWCLEL